jgi:hypothetical protein
MACSGGTLQERINSCHARSEGQKCLREAALMAIQDKKKEQGSGIPALWFRLNDAVM